METPHREDIGELCIECPSPTKPEHGSVVEVVTAGAQVESQALTCVTEPMITANDLLD